jgi:predicted nucleotidyltransferase
MLLEPVDVAFAGHPEPRSRTVPRKPTRQQITEADRSMLARQAAFRRAADAIAAELAGVPEVRAISLFGSVARVLEREVPRFQPFRSHRIEILHECRDIDIAVWIDRFDNLAALNRARSRAVANLFKDTGIGVAHHQVEIFLFGDGWHDYRGRLCTYGQCPKGKVECLTPGCGRELFLKQHQDFVLAPDALATAVPLYERG